jgi:hypothetical protein
MPPTSETPPRLMSDAPRTIHSAQVYIFPSAVWADDRDVELFGQPGRTTTRCARGIGSSGQWKPSFSSSRADVERVLPTVIVVAVEHQVHVRTDRLPDCRAGRDVTRRVGRGATSRCGA